MTLRQQIYDDLRTRGQYYTGGDLASVVDDWCDRFSTAAEIAAWLDAGYWDAMAAEEAAAIYSPTMAARIAADQEARGQCYPSGGLIYAHCNGDATLADYEATP